MRTLSLPTKGRRGERTGERSSTAGRPVAATSAAVPSEKVRTSSPSPSQSFSHDGGVESEARSSRYEDQGPRSVTNRRTPARISRA